jgi:DNA polymerase (family 10)
MSLNHELADLFSTMADIMDIKGENTFKVLAFRKVGRVLKDMTLDVRKSVEEGTIGEVEGIGQHSRRIIEEYVRTGKSADAEELAKSVPAGLLPLLSVEGLGPKTIALLWRERKITDADKLLAALDDGSLKGLKGIGEKKLAGIRQGLEARAKASGRIGIGEALPVAAELLERVRQIAGVIDAEIAGSLRRRRETIGDLDLLCSVKDLSTGAKVTAEFVKLPTASRVLGQGAIKASIVTDSGLQVDLRVLPQEHFGAALLYFTGSKEHNVKIRSLAQKKGMTLNEWGLYRLDEYEQAEKKTAEAPRIKPLASRTEESIYRKLGMAYVEPEMREDRGEVEAALEGRLPKLITRADMRGDLHSHTTASDGRGSIEQMAEAAKALGYEYLAITDHSKSSAIANGLSAERLLKHIAEVRKISDRLKGITLLAGSEVDILADGHLDYEDSVLAELDIVIASPHVALKQDSAKATDRLRRAIENRYVNIIGHPTGRLIGGREGLPLDFAVLFKLAAETGTAMEINAGYPRLDLNDVNARAAVASGVMLSINTDAHSEPELAGIEFGLGVARRAWVEARNVINCLRLAELRKFLARKK